VRDSVCVFVCASLWVSEWVCVWSCVCVFAWVSVQVRVCVCVRARIRDRVLKTKRGTKRKKWPWIIFISQTQSVASRPQFRLLLHLRDTRTPKMCLCYAHWNRKYRYVSQAWRYLLTCLLFALRHFLSPSYIHDVEKYYFTFGVENFLLVGKQRKLELCGHCKISWFFVGNG
jgi:hypothetical protein